jgi:hypothetical protein
MFPLAPKLFDFSVLARETGIAGDGPRFGVLVFRMSEYMGSRANII